MNETTEVIFLIPLRYYIKKLATVLFFNNNAVVLHCNYFYNVDMWTMCASFI